jgi:hypothetical protein
MRRCRVRLILLCLCSVSLLAAFSGPRYLDEIGHLGPPFDSRTSVQLGRTKVVRVDDSFHFEGRDDDGKSWQAILPVSGGVGFTTVWQADFDYNSRQDLLIAAYFPTNGRCVDEITLSFLLFNERGQPVPWVIHTRMHGRKFPYVPAIFSNHNHRAELVVTDCAYSSPPRLGEDRSITGVYEAKDATWSLIEPANMDPYTALVRQSHRFDPRFVRLLPSNPIDWLDQGNRPDPRKSPSVRLAAVLPASGSCRGVRLPIVDGRLQKEREDPCQELGRDRLQLSDGTVCYGIPTVMLDSKNGREIVAESENPEPLLRQVIEERSAVVLVGQRELNRCSPVLLRAISTR